MNEKQLAIQALQQMKGDDLQRAEMSFRRMSPEELDQQHGASGKTRREILQEYRDYNAKVDAAIAWVSSRS